MNRVIATAAVDEGSEAAPTTAREQPVNVLLSVLLIILLSSVVVVSLL